MTVSTNLGHEHRAVTRHALSARIANAEMSKHEQRAHEQRAGAPGDRVSLLDARQQVLVLLRQQQRASGRRVHVVVNRPAPAMQLSST